MLRCDRNLLVFQGPGNVSSVSQIGPGFRRILVATGDYDVAEVGGSKGAPLSMTHLSFVSLSFLESPFFSFSHLHSLINERKGREQVERD